ncbi:efflux RND transporter permease subunit [Gemmatimonadota bacterium]
MSDLDRYKEIGLTSLAIRNPISVIVLIVIIVVMGLSSYSRIPKEASPEITIPNIVVSTIYPGASPDDMESLVTQPLEQELATIDDIKVLTSSSVESASSVNVEFIAGTDMDEALRNVREKVDLARPELPDEAEEPQVIEINMSDFPIMQINIAGDYSQVRLKEIAEDLQDELESIPQVLEVNLSGGLEREVQVNVDLPRLKYYNLTFSDVVFAIVAENVTIPGGAIDVGHLKYLVRVPGEFTDTELIRDIIISTNENDDRPIYVRDVADVDFGFKERTSFARMDGSPVVTLSVSKRAGENIIETAEQVKAEIDKLRPELPLGTQVTITGDQSVYIEDMVSNLENNIISGLILVVAVLLFFLGLKNALFVGVAIPLSMLLSFIIMDIAGMTMNMIVLFSLILALGMLVDNAIVIVENIYRYMEEGFDRVTAAKKASGEVAVPVIAATATTLAAFLPLAFWPGIVGEFMGYLPQTLIITLSSSLFVALVINPTLCSLFMSIQGSERKRMTRGARGLILGATALMLMLVSASNMLTGTLFVATGVLLWLLYRLIILPVGTFFLDTLLPKVLHLYERQLSLALDHRWTTIAIAGSAFIITFMMFGRFSRGVEFFPENIPPDNLFVQLEAPVGTRVDFTDYLIKQVEVEVAGLEGRADFESVVSTVGSVQGGFVGGSSENLATVAISIVDYEERQNDAFTTLEEMRNRIGQGLAGADVSVEMDEMGPPTGLPVTIEIAGSDAATLAILGDQVVEILENSAVGPKLDGLESDLAEGRPELVVNVDRELAALFGLSTNQIGFEVRSAINGVEASTYRDGDDEYDVIVRLAQEYRQNLDALSDLTVMDEGQAIPLSSVATWEVAEGYGGINRKDQERMVVVSSEVRSGYQSTVVLMEIQRLLQPFTESLPAGYTIAYAGENQDQEEAQEFLSQAFLIALFLISFILISQFNSVTKPFLILINIVLSLVGVLLGLLLFQMPFGIIMTGVGIMTMGSGKVRAQFSEFQLPPGQENGGSVNFSPGMTWIGDQAYFSFTLEPELAFGKIGVGLRLPLLFDAETFELRKVDWDQSRDYARLLRYVRYGVKRDPFYVRVGELSNTLFGHGFSVYYYNNNIDLQNPKRGAQLDVDFQKFGFESMISNFGEKEVYGVRGYARPLQLLGKEIPVIQNLAFGLTMITDQDAMLPEPVNIFGFDFEQPLLHNDMLDLYLYFDWSSIKSWNSQDHGNGTAYGIATDIRGIAGLFAIGAKFEMRNLSEGFTAGLIGPLWDVNKTSIMADLPSQPEAKGWYGELVGTILGRISLSGMYFETGESTMGDQFVLHADATKLLPGITLQAFHVKQNIQDGGDLFKLDEDAMTIAEVGWSPNKLMTVLMRYEWSYVWDGSIPGFRSQERISPRVQFGVSW